MPGAESFEMFHVSRFILADRTNTCGWSVRRALPYTRSINNEREEQSVYRYVFHQESFSGN